MDDFCLVEHFKENTTGINLSWRSTSLSVDCEKRIPSLENGDPWEEGEELVALKASHNALISVHTKSFIFEFVIGLVVIQNEAGEKLEKDQFNNSTGFNTNQSYVSEYQSTLTFITGSQINIAPFLLSDSDNKNNKIVHKIYYEPKEYELRKSIVMRLNDNLISTSKESHNQKVRLQNMVDDIHKKGVSVSLEKTLLLAGKT